MVSIMTQIIKNLSPLRIGAPEWYPIQKGQERENIRSDEKHAEELWQVQKKRSQNKRHKTDKADYKYHNRCEVLSEDDNEEIFACDEEVDDMFEKVNGCDKGGKN